MGTQVYLSCTLNEELLDGHCLIVPIQHHLTMLEADDDVWDEVRVRNHHLSHTSLLTHFTELHEKRHAHVR
jgi:hypothetical protein